MLTILVVPPRSSLLTRLADSGVKEKREAGWDERNTDRRNERIVGKLERLSCSGITLRSGGRGAEPPAGAVM